jgi:hypothetical protein
MTKAEKAAKEAWRAYVLLARGDVRSNPSDLRARVEYARGAVEKIIRAQPHGPIPTARLWSMYSILHIVYAALGMVDEFDCIARAGGAEDTYNRIARLATQGDIARAENQIAKKLYDALDQRTPWMHLIPWIGVNIARDWCDRVTNLRAADLPYIGKLTRPDAMDKLNAWVKANRVDIGRVKLSDVVDKLFETEDRPEQGPIVYTYANNWTLQSLATKKALADEGDTMNHCVGGYWNKVRDDKTEIFSLRDERGWPLVTIEYQDGDIIQMMGVNDSIPPPRCKGALLEAIHEVFHDSAAGYLYLNEPDRTPDKVMAEYLSRVCLQQDRHARGGLGKLAESHSFAGGHPLSIAVLTEHGTPSAKNMLAMNPGVPDGIILRLCARDGEEGEIAARYLAFNPRALESPKLHKFVLNNVKNPRYAAMAAAVAARRDIGEHPDVAMALATANYRK